MSEIISVFYMNVSPDEDARKAKESVRVKVTAKFIDFSAQDFADRCTQANSVRVAVQAVLRGKKTIPTEYTYIVPKPGTRLVQAASIEDLWAAMSPEQRNAFIAGKLEKAEALMAKDEEEE